LRSVLRPETKLRETIMSGGFTRVRRAAATPFNLVRSRGLELNQIAVHPVHPPAGLDALGRHSGSAGPTSRCSRWRP
jgi:hypothetical protein